MTCNRYLAIFLLIVGMIAGHSSSYAMGSHFIENYRDYPVNQGGQTWSISPYDNDWIYFANKNGLYQFDGNNWSVVTMHNHEDVRSVQACKATHRVYIGGINEFGYVSPNDRGFLQYTCLSKNLGDEKNIGNIWGIYAHEGRIYAQGDHDLLIYQRGKANVIRTHEKLNCSNMVNGVLYLGTEQGLKVLVGSNVSPAYGSQALNGKRIRSLIAYKQGILAVTDVAGVYYYNGNTTTQLTFNGDWQQRMTDLFCGAVKGNTLALGTISNGLFVVDLSTGNVQHYNQSTGLQDNTVLSLTFDNSGNLWAGLDSGIDCVLLSLPITELFTRDSNIGAGYVAEIYNNCLYCGTNRGLYVAPFGITTNAPSMRLYGSLSGQVWGIEHIGNDLFCLHDRGLIQLTDGGSQQLDITDGAWHTEQLKGNPNRAYVGTYDGLRIIEKNAGGVWHTIKNIDGCYVSAYSFTQESDYCVWLIDSHTSAVRITLDAKTLRVKKQQRYGKDKGLPTVDDITVCNIDGQICFSTPNGVYRYDKKTDRIVAYNEINKLLGNRDNILHIETRGKYIYALTTNEMVRACGNKIVSLPIMPTKAKSFHPAHPFTVVNDSTAILPNHTGYSVYHFSAAGKVVTAAEKYGRINRVSLTSRGDSAIFTSNFLQRKADIEIPYRENSVKITYGMPTQNNAYVDGYKYRINKGEWSDITLSNIKEYTNLSEGTYTFEVVALLTTGQTATDSITFKILPPWYRSTAAKIIYIVLVIVAIWLLYMLSNKRIAKAAHKVEIAKDAELKEKDEEIHQLEKLQLKSEIEHKSQEIVNLLLSVSNKHEVLINIKEELQKVRSNLKGDITNRKLLIALQEQIDTALQSEKVLDRIDKEFDLVHNDFTKKLRADYPDLTSNEVKMCSYIKMNLSTKEIAPLMNMSMRGVETIRYRMRKKFGLERSDSLTEFIRRR